MGLVLKMVRSFLLEPKFFMSTLFLLIISVGCLVYMPSLVSSILNFGWDTDSFTLDNVGVKLILLAVIYLIFIVSNGLREYLFLSRSDTVISSIREEMFLNGLKRNFEKVDLSDRVRFSNSFSYDIQNAQSFLTSIIPLVQSSFLRVFVSLAILFYMDFYSSLLYVLIMASVFSILLIFERQVRHHIEVVREAYKETFRVTVSPIKYNSFVLQAGMLNFEIERFKRAMSFFISKIRTKRLVHYSLDLLFKVVVAIVFIFYVFVLFFNYKSGTVEYDFIEYVGLIFILTYSFANLIVCIGGFIRASESLKVIGSEVSSRNLYEIYQDPFLHNVKISKLEIVDVGKGEVITVYPKEVLMIRGESGCGKTTLCKAIAGIRENSRFKVSLIDGGGAKLDKGLFYCGLVCYLPATPEIFNTTVYNNLIYGTTSKIEDCYLNQLIVLLELDKVFSRLSDGLNTEIGDHGCSLSTGELQRISIIRCILFNPKVVILDEAISVLDTRRTSKVIDILKGIGCITIIVSHRECELFSEVKNLYMDVI